jgi:FkbM family methyltransferase
MRARKLARILREPRYRRALRHGVAASIEHEAIPFRRDFATIVDIGANRGQFALFADVWFSRATIICFEPIPEALVKLQRVMGNRPRLDVFGMALSDRSGTAEFHVSKADDSSSLLRATQRERENFRGSGERTTIQVELRRLDEMLKPAGLLGPVLLKIDVQGEELGVLRGSGVVLDSVDALLVEASFIELYEGQPLVDEVWSFMRAAGFTCRGAWSTSYGRRGECLLADLLFARGGFDPFA